MDQNKQIGMLKDVYKSAVRASYFNAIKNDQFTKKAKNQMERSSRLIENSIDQKTFRLIKGFKRPNDNFKIYSKKGKVYTTKSGFLCFGNMKTNYDAQLNNSKFFLKQGEQIHYFVDFNAVSTQLLEKQSQIMIQFQGLPKQRRIIFRTQNKSQQQHKAWTKILWNVIHESKGAQKHYTYLARTCPKFQQSQQILNQQFQQQANTGDIILFRCQHGAARAQRFLTNSQFDHVGVVLRNKKNQIYIFQSTSDEGVGMTPWKDMIQYKWYQQCQKIAWRPLKNQVLDYQIDVVQAFVAKTLGKQYSINMDKLFQFTSRLQRSKQEDEKKTYFCSELVARLYKQLKYIDGEKSSTNYFPVDFSMKGQIKFIKNQVSLGNQKIIAFESK